MLFGVQLDGLVEMRGAKLLFHGSSLLELGMQGQNYGLQSLQSLMLDQVQILGKFDQTTDDSLHFCIGLILGVLTSRGGVEYRVLDILGRLRPDKHHRNYVLPCLIWQIDLATKLTLTPYSLQAVRMNAVKFKPMCRDGHPAVIVCVSQNCCIPNPFVCANCSTESCFKDHLHCIKELWSTFQQRMLGCQPKTRGLKELEASVNKVITRMMSTVVECREEFSQWLAENYYNSDIKRIFNFLDESKFHRLAGTDMYYANKVAQASTKPAQAMFMKYYEDRAETILALTKNLRDSVTKLYTEDVQINLPSTEIASTSFSFGNQQTMAHEKIIIRKDSIDWQTVSKQKKISLENQLTQEGHFQKLRRMNLSNTTVLRLSNNNISCLAWMKGMVFPCLYEFCLDYNIIQDLSPMEGLFMPMLKGLYLEYNQIRSIKPLIKFHSPYLQTLNLSFNQIERADQLQGCQFQQLKTLMLHDNMISNIDVFLKLRRSPKLEMVTLDTNNLPYQAQKFKRLMVSIKSRYLNCSFRVHMQ